MAKSGLPRNLQRLSRDKVDGLIAERTDAFLEARRRVETAGRKHGLAEAERIRGEGMDDARQAAGQLKALRQELARRQEEAPVSGALRRAAAASVGAESTFELMEHERQREEARAEQRQERERELALLRRQDEQRKRDELIAAGRIYQPVGGWDQDAADAIAAVVSSEYVWRCLRRADGDPMPVLDAQHLAMLIVTLGVLAENSGEVTVDLNRPFPRLPHDISKNRREMLRHLEANRFLSLSGSKGSVVTIRRGPLTEELRASFQAEWRQRAKPPTVTQEVTRMFEEFKASLRGKGEQPSGEPGPA
jgi:hypothetical protein